MFDNSEGKFAIVYQHLERRRSLKELMKKMLEFYCKKDMNTGEEQFQQRIEKLKLEYPKSNPSVNAVQIDVLVKEVIDSMQKKSKDERCHLVDAVVI